MTKTSSPCPPQHGSITPAHARVAPFNDAIFADILSFAPIFGAAEIAELRAHISTIAQIGPDVAYLGRLDRSNIALNPSLMECFITSRVDDFSGFALTDDQIEVTKRILNAYNPHKRRVIIVRGGPGAGKSVVGLHLLKEFLKKAMADSMGRRNTKQTKRCEVLRGWLNLEGLGCHRLRRLSYGTDGAEASRSVILLVLSKKLPARFTVFFPVEAVSLRPSGSAPALP